MLSSPAWGLDHDRLIASNEASSAQILSTLGRHKAPNIATSRGTHRMVQVKLITKAKARKRR